MKTIKLILSLTVVLAFAACNKDVEETSNIVSKQNVETTEFPKEVQELLNTVTVKRPSTQAEIVRIKQKLNLQLKCDLPSRLHCDKAGDVSANYITNCIKHDLPQYGDFYTNTVYTALNYSNVYSSGEVHLSEYDLQGMMDKVFEQTGPVWGVDAQVHRATNSCSTKFAYVVFKLTIYSPKKK